MIPRAGTQSGAANRLAIARSGLWPTLLTFLLALLFAAGQESVPTTEPGAAAAPGSPAAAPGSPAEKVAAGPNIPAPSSATSTSVSPATSPAAASGAASVSAGSTAPGTSTEPAARVQPFEYSPYKIQVWLAAAPSPELSAERLAEVREELARRADVVVGAPWSLAVSEPPESLHYSVAMCPRLLTAAAVGEVAKERFKDDKLMVVSLSATPREFQVLARELDCHTRTWGPDIARTVRQPNELSSVVFATVVAAFGTLARIEDGQGKICVVRGRATGLITSPDSPAQISKGDVLQPIFRQNDRQGNPVPGKTEPLPFTYLHVSSADPESPSLLNCNVHSGMRSPIHGRSISTSRRERWAIKVRPRFPGTMVLVESKPLRRNDPRIPLSGIEVYSKTPEPEAPKEQSEEEKKAEDKKNPAQLLGVTDWRGALSLNQGGPTLRILYLKNGGLLLARLPIVAGLNERAVAELPDDNPRLQAEGFVRGMNSEVTDLVVQRQLIAVRMRKKIKELKLDEAEKLHEEFRGLKTLNDLQQMLNGQLQRQEPTNSPAVRQKIDKLYGDERELLGKYIDAELPVKLLSELTAARANPVTPEEPAAGNFLEASKADEEKKAALPGALKSKDAPAAESN